MADQKLRYTTEPLILRAESGQLIQPNELASEIKNFTATPEGTLVSIEGPAPYVPSSAGAQAIGDPQPALLEYAGKITGIFHALLMRGAREVLLIQDHGAIKVHQGWNPNGTFESIWDVLIGASSTNPIIEVNFSTDGQAAFPCQFEATPRGIVIVPQPYQRAYFYDGEVILPLGYDTAPSPPVGYGPETINPEKAWNIGNNLGPNEAGFSIDSAGTGTKGIFKDFGYGRIGTYQYQQPSESDHGGDRLLEGSWQAAVQWIDYFGNLSPVSPRSNEITFDMQPVGSYSGIVSVKELGKTVAWANIDIGPEGTVGRNVFRTKDLINSGKTDLYHIGLNTGFGASISAFATLPDNRVNRLPDNIPDTWLLSVAEKIRPVPLFKLCRLAFGRLWVGNTRDDSGLLCYSIPGRYGTFRLADVMYPDPNGYELTGMWAIPEGLLVTTESSTYIILRSDDGLSFKSATLSTTIGCIAPSSFGTMADGSVIWLSRDGFYAYKEANLEPISRPIHPTIQRINWGRALGACAAVDPTSQEYRCWVPIDGSEENSLALIWDGVGWRRREHEKLRCVCVTRDHRRYMLGGGTVRLAEETTGSESVWLLDHAVSNTEMSFPEARIESAWISWRRSKEKKSVKSIYIAFRETYAGTVTVQVYRDWREGSEPAYNDTVSGTTILEEDAPPLWGTTAWDETDAEYTLRRPYWKKIDIDIPSCEVYKIVITATNRVEFIGMAVDEEPKLGGFGSRIS